MDSPWQNPWVQEGPCSAEAFESHPLSSQPTSSIAKHGPSPTPRCPLYRGSIWWTGCPIQVCDMLQPNTLEPGGQVNVSVPRFLCWRPDPQYGPILRWGCLSLSVMSACLMFCSCVFIKVWWASPVLRLLGSKRMKCKKKLDSKQERIERLSGSSPHHTPEKLHPLWCFLKGSGNLGSFSYSPLATTLSWHNVTGLFIMPCSFALQRTCVQGSLSVAVNLLGLPQDFSVNKVTN